jgi:glucosamine--fructose-6-phosphate aminotransferase (isomerizing)
MERKFKTYSEIISQADVLVQTARDLSEDPHFVAAREILRSTRQLIFTGCGSSFHIGEIASFVFNSLGYNAQAVPGSELLLYPSIFLKAPCPAVIGITRSGNTTETVLALRRVRGLGVRDIIPITCYQDSDILAESPHSLIFHRGQEQGLVMTRAFTVILYGLCRMALEAMNRSALELHTIPAWIQHSIDCNEAAIRKLAENRKWTKVIFLGSGVFQGLAREASLKLKEMTGMQAEPYQSYEFRHGPKAIVDGNTLVFLFSSVEELDYVNAVIRDLSSMGATVVQIGRKKIEDESVVSLPDTDLSITTLFQPLALVHIPQLFAFFKTVSMGANPDTPLHLTRVVTI